MLTEITEILRQYKNDPTLTITPETTFGQLSLDSLETVQLIMDLEDKFGVTLDTNADMNCIGDVMAAIEQAK